MTSRRSATGDARMQHNSGRNRFDSFRFRTFRKWIGSAPLVNSISPARRRSACVFRTASWLGPVRFGSVPRPVPAGSRIKQFASVRPVRFLIPSCTQTDKQANKRAAKAVIASKTNKTYRCYAQNTKKR